MIPELRTLIAVAQCGTFAAAGERLGLTQAAISGHVRRLEQSLGFALFDRTGRSATLNAAGMRTLARAVDIVVRFDMLGSATRDEDAVGILRVGAIASVQSTIVARALVPFRARYPRHGVHLSPGVSLHLMDRVDSGELDLAVLVRPWFTPPAELRWRSLFRETYAMLVPESVEGEDWRGIVAEHPFIQYDRGSFGGRQVDRFFRNASLQPSQWLEIDDLPAMVAMVANGLGVAIVPCTEVTALVPSGVRAIALAPDLIHRDIGMLSRRSVASETVGTFMTYLVDEARDLAHRTVIDHQ